MATYSRNDWGALPAKPPGLTPASAAAISLVVHHTGSGSAPADVADAMAMLRSVQAAHQAGEYVDIAYNAAVDQFGNIYECRGMNMLSAATYSANDRTRAVVWLGGSDVDTPSDAALRAVADLWRLEAGRSLTADSTITGHRDWTATACPGDCLYGLLPAIRRYASGVVEEEHSLKAYVSDGSVILTDGLYYRVLPGSWPDVNQQLIGLVAAGLIPGDSNGAPLLPAISASALLALIQEH